MIYLDNAATTNRKPSGVIKAVKEELRRSANPGRASHGPALLSMSRVSAAREMLSRLFNVQNEENFILTPNATYALNFAIKGYVKAGDHVISTSMEHNSVIRPLYSLKNVKTTYVKGRAFGFISPEDIEKEIREDTKLIVVNHSSNVNGIVQDVEKISKIARARGIAILLDASQTAGLININAGDYDMIALPGHKSLYGPQGTGALYVRDRLMLTPIIEGGTGSDSKNKENPIFLPDRLESGTLNTPGFYGLSKGIEFVLREGVDSIREYEHMLLNRLIYALYSMDNIIVYSPAEAEPLANSVAFNIKGMDGASAAQILNDEYGIAVRPGYHCAYPAHVTIGSGEMGAVRASLSYFNTKREIDKFINAIAKIENM